MRLVWCDNHSDRKAVVTVRFSATAAEKYVHAPLISVPSLGQKRDLCASCAKKLGIKVPS